MQSPVLLSSHQLLFESGSRSDVVYLLESGELEAFSQTGSQTTTLGKIKAGEFAGELGVLQGQKRSASVRATSRAQLQPFTREEFIELISRNPDHCQRLIHSLSLRTRTLLQLINDVELELEHSEPQKISRLEAIWLRFFSWLKSKIQGLQQTEPGEPIQQTNSGRLRLKPGDTLFHEGQDSRVACKLVSGKLKVVKSSAQKQRSLGTIAPGEFVGEIGLLENTPRSATVIASMRSELEIYTEAGLQDLIASQAEVGQRIIDSLSRRAIGLRKTCDRLLKQHETHLDRPTRARIQAVMRAASEAYEVTGERFERDFQALQRGLVLEAIATRGMLGTYYRFLKRQATPEQMEQANADFRNLVKSLGLGTMFLLPGSPITIPAAIKAAKSLGIDILPKNRLDEDEPPNNKA